MCPHMLYVVCCKRARKSILIAKTVRVAWEVVKRDQVTVAAWPAPYICTYGYICGVDILYLWTCHRKTRELLRSSCCPLLLVWPHKNLATLHICPQLFLPSQHCIFVQSNETFHSSFFCSGSLFVWRSVKSKLSPRQPRNALWEFCGIFINSSPPPHRSYESGSLCVS